MIENQIKEEKGTISKKQINRQTDVNSMKKERKSGKEQERERSEKNERERR